MAKHCDLSTDAARLRDALDQLQAAWQETTESWNDATSHRFAQQHLDPLAPVVKISMDAIGRMTQLVGQMIQDCES